MRRGKESRVGTIAEDSHLTQKDINNGSTHSSSRKRSAVDRNKKGSSSSRNNKSNATTNPASTSRDPSKKAVHWNPKVVKKRHIQLKDMKDEERESVWYNDNDSRIMLAMAKVTVKMMMNGEACDGINYCSRGLEGKTMDGSKIRNKHKNLVRHAVLTLQEIHRMDGMNNPEELANVSFECTEIPFTEARDKAIQDERDIQAYLNDVRIHRDYCLKLLPA